MAAIFATVFDDVTCTLKLEGDIVLRVETHFKIDQVGWLQKGKQGRFSGFPSKAPLLAGTTTDSVFSLSARVVARPRRTNRSKDGIKDALGVQLAAPVVLVLRPIGGGAGAGLYGGIALAKIDQVFACWAPACRQGPAARVGEPFDLRLPQLVRPLHRERGQTSARRHALPLRGRRQLLQLHIPHHSVVESFHSLVLVVVVAERRLLPASRFHEVGPSPLRRRALDLGSLLPSGAFSNAAAAQRLRST